MKFNQGLVQAVVLAVRGTSRYVFNVIQVCARLLDLLKRDSGQFVILRPWAEEQVDWQMKLTSSVVHPYSSEFIARIHTPNQVCLARVRSIWEKEPETIAWMDRASSSAVLFDVGANIGLYSIYFARHRKGVCDGRHVVAFEPSVQNIEQLVRNIQLNALTSCVTIITNPLWGGVSIAPMNLSSMILGGSAASFHSKLNELGMQSDWEYEYLTLGVSLDSLFDLGALTRVPTMIKIDVDGGENVILTGAVKTLRQTEVRSILIEVGENQTESQDAMSKILFDLGFRKEIYPNMKRRCDSGSETKARYNMVWSRQ